MTDWTDSEVVERTPSRVSGAWVVTGTRIPLHALYDNLAAVHQLMISSSGFLASLKNRYARFLSTKHVSFATR